MPKVKSLTASGYSTLVKRIQSELSELDFFVKRRTAESYWKVGKFIHEHLLENKDRADYGHTFYDRLAKDIDRDKSTLMRSVQFFRTYPILAERRELTWEHYRSLITIKDDKERKKVEEKAARNDWSSTKLREYLGYKRELDVPEDDHKPVVQLKVTRGKVGICTVIAGEDGVYLDLGFRMRKFFPEGKNLRLKDGDFVEVTQDNGKWTAEKTDIEKDALYTYKAEVGKIVDGDTLWVTIEVGFDIFIEQKLRLRGIDCPENDTEEGKAAKKFVESCLKGLNFIIIKTHKDSVDKYDRYLADVFYGKDGAYLNQELLNNRLAVVY